MIEDDAEQVQELEDMLLGAARGIEVKSHSLLYAAKGIEAKLQSRQAIWVNPSFLTEATNLLTEAMYRIYNAREYMRERNAA